MTRRRTSRQFQIHTKEPAPEASRATLEATAKKYGFLPNLFGVLAESPTAVQAYAAINKALEQSALTPVEQQVVALTVSTSNDCAYCVGAHSTAAQMVRMPEDVLAALREQSPLPDRKLNALRTLVLSVLHHRGWVLEEDLEHFVAAGYAQRHVLDVLTLLALKTLSNYVNHIAHTPLDPQFAFQEWEAQAVTVVRRAQPVPSD
jgi:uncharacterized peroxidase-related enzyme